MKNFVDMPKGIMDWHQKYNADLGELYSEVASAKAGGLLNLYTHTKEGKAHSLTGEGTIIRFLAAAPWALGDAVTVNGAAVEPKTPEGQPLPTDAFVSGMWVVAIKSGSTLQFITQSNAGAAACPEELQKYALLGHDHQTADVDGLREELDGLRRKLDTAADTLGSEIEDVKGSIDALSAALFEDITTNPFTITFANLDGVVVESGVWNEARQRLEC